MGFCQAQSPGESPEQLKQGVGEEPKRVAPLLFHCAYEEKYGEGVAPRKNRNLVHDWS